MSDALQLAQAYFEAWNRHDAAGIVVTFAEGGRESFTAKMGQDGPTPDFIDNRRRGARPCAPTVLIPFVGNVYRWL